MSPDSKVPHPKAARGAWTSTQAREAPCLSVMRELAKTFQAFERFDAAQLRDRGLTVPQADVIFTLGNTEGMTFKELGEKTLITKGTLTGVVDRLEQKQLVKRQPSSEDRRSIRVVLTKRGSDLFERIFPKHVAAFQERFDRLSSAQLEKMSSTLRRLRGLFE